MKLLILLLSLTLFSFISRATHIIGGEIYYDNLGGGNYRITLEVFRDCFNGVAPFDDPLQFTVFNTDGSQVGVFDFAVQSITVLPYVSQDPCVVPPTDFCVELGAYSDIINLPDSPTGYIIAYTRCCWSNSILNIELPGDNGLTITSFIPPTSIVNSNPRFTNYPPLILCADRPLDFDHVATDPDGDSLAYSIVTPFSGGDPGNPIPNPEPTPPFPFNNYASGFSLTQPFGANSTVSIDPNTGLLTFNPNLLGNFVLAVEVREYRNGQLISTKFRTYGYRVVACAVIPPIEVDIQGTLDQIEDCSSAMFIISRNTADSTLVVQVNMTGTATNGEDYTFVPNTLTLPTGVLSDSISIVSLFDEFNESTETVDIEIIITSPCNPEESDTTRASLNITNYNPIALTYTNYFEVCDELQDEYPLSVNMSGGVAPFSITWTPSGTGNSTSVDIPSSTWVPQENYYTMTVSDACQKSAATDTITLMNQCPLVAPNIITTNIDATNEYFIIRNLEDFDEVALIVVNRWGNVIYENTNYKNDWDGKDKNGKYLNDGVYFYQVVPNDDRYTYSDKEKLKFTLHGFLHITRGEQ